MASQSEIRRIVGAAVLSGDDVLDVVFESAMFLAEQAVLTCILCAISDKFAHTRVHKVGARRRTNGSVRELSLSGWK